MLKKILAAAAAAAMSLSLAGCSKEYTMTTEDLELQRSLVGYWAADDSTGYNEYDENGYLTMMIAVQFTDDFHYILYNYFPTYSDDPNEPSSYITSYAPISYTIENEMFRVDVNGLASYARISISEDGSIMNWITDDGTDRYLSFSAERADELGFPEYDPDALTETGSSGDTSAEQSVTDSSEE